MVQTSRALLIVDDSPEDRELYRRYLLRDREYCYTILEATLGRQGLELWQQHQPDAVLLDYRLPDLDGLEFLAQLQSSTQTHSLPVIVLTGQGNEAIAVQAMKAGAQDYLIKEQITPEGLQVALNGAIATVQLQTQLHQRIERERLVAQITRKLHQTLDLDEILQTAVDEVRQFLQTDRVLIFRLQSEGQGTVVTESVSTAWTPFLSTSYYDPCLEQDYIEPFRQGLVTVKPDIYDGSIAPCHVDLLATLQVRANLVVPILQNGQLWGMLIAHHCAAARQWQPLEIDLLKELATQVGIALQQAVLYQQAQAELTERRRVEAELRQRERLFATLAEASPVAIFRFDAANNCVYVNNRWSELTGRSIETAYGLGWSQTLHPDDRDRLTQDWWQWCQNARQNGLYQTEGRYLRADGSVVWFYLQALADVEANGETVGYIGVLTDITNRKQTEVSLQESQRQLQQQLAEIEAIYQSAPIGLNVLDTDFRFVRINQRLAEINGRSVEAHLGRTVREVVPDLADTAEQLLRPILETGEPLLNVEITGETPAQPGVQRTWVEHFLPLKNGDRVIGINTVCEEITERKRLEAERKRAEAELRQAKEELEIRVTERTAELQQLNAELQQSESTLRSFFNSGAMPMGIVELHNDDILHISDNWAAAQFFGTPSGAMQHQYASTLGTTPEIIQRWVAYYRQAEQTQMPVRFEYLHTTAKGQCWLSGSVCSIAASPSGYPRFSYIVEDVTDRKQAEADIAASLKEKEVLLKEIHHRVKNNLGIVSGLLQMQSRRTQDAKANAILKVSQNRIDSIALVHEKLYRSDDLARVDFSQYIRDLTVYLFDSYNINSNRIVLSTQVDVNVSLDIETAIPCGLIISELVSNALKHGFPSLSSQSARHQQIGADSSVHQGEVQIRLEQLNHPTQEPHQRTLVLIIRDDGVGLSDNFDLKSSKTLGLSLVQGLVMQIGGTLEINSQQGTEFKITFTKTEP